MIPATPFTLPPVESLVKNPNDLEALAALAALYAADDVENPHEAAQDVQRWALDMQQHTEAEAFINADTARANRVRNIARVTAGFRVAEEPKFDVEFGGRRPYREAGYVHVGAAWIAARM